VVEQRRYKRFDVRLPVKLVRNGLRPITGAGQTRNLSSGGVLFSSDTKVDIGEPIEYIISLTANGKVHLHCIGKVMRLDACAPEWQDPGKPFDMAVTLERYEFVRKNGAA
jgi:hypothetical protein